MPGRGLCEACHRDTKFYRADGHGQPHFTDDCALCHDHTAAFRPAVGDASCAICHTAEAARLAKSGLHHTKFAERCSACHAQATPEPGPGHRATAACNDCHAAERVSAHTPSGKLIPCTQCHEPHGSDNASLIREMIHTPQGTDRTVHFATLDGRADGSFADASIPGTGLCETCHSQTQFYRADGSGATHFTDTCIRCHQHARGFAPR